MKREELIAYDNWLTKRKWGSSEIITPEQAADAYLAENPLPPAEGAEAFVKSLGLNVDYVKGIDLFPNPKYTVIDLMREFAEQSQPTAEGAEEILKRHCKENKIILTSNDFHTWLNAINEIATLHAQRLAEKMVEEKLREELIAYDKWVGEKYIDNYRHETAPAIVDEYLKSKEQ